MARLTARPGSRVTMQPLKFGAVATGDRHTTQAAAEILQEGGNAVDAALAALACACLAEPILASLGAGGYLLAQPANGRPLLYDFFVQTPRKKRPEADLDFVSVHADFGPDTQEFHIGHGAAATPGVVQALAEIAAEHGRMPLARILVPAISRAREGIAFSPMQAHLLQVVEPIVRADPAMEALASKSDGKNLLEPGDIFAWPALADMLEAIAHEGPRLFYEGEIAAAMADASASGGGHLTMEDFKSYRVEKRQPLSLDFRDWQLAVNPPPAAGGAMIGLMLKLLEAGPPLPAGSSIERYDRLSQAMGLVNRIRRDLCGGSEPDYHQLLDPDLLAGYLDGSAPEPQTVRGTTHISVADAAGNIVALTVSNGEGCGRLAPFGGFMLNNMLGEEDLCPGGFHTWRPNRRMSSMMAPGVAIDRAGRRVGFGSGGSNRIRTAITQVLANLIDGGMALAEAIEAPRLHLEPDMLHVEGGIEPDLIPEADQYAKSSRFWPGQSLFFGGVHLAAWQPGTKGEAAADPRRGGDCWVA